MNENQWLSTENPYDDGNIIGIYDEWRDEYYDGDKKQRKVFLDNVNGPIGEVLTYLQWDGDYEDTNMEREEWQIHEGGWKIGNIVNIIGMATIVIKYRINPDNSLTCIGEYGAGGRIHYPKESQRTFKKIN